jgi:hypothetical protein
MVVFSPLIAGVRVGDPARAEVAGFVGGLGRLDAAEVFASTRSASARTTR